MTGLTVCERHSEVVVPGAMTELVRGQEAGLLERLEPLVRQGSVVLDMSHVARIDAAGLAALIKLYCEASRTGHEFTVTRPGRHVREVLTLMGLVGLLTGEANRCGSGSGVRDTAA